MRIGFPRLHRALLLSAAMAGLLLVLHPGSAISGVKQQPSQKPSQPYAPDEILIKFKSAAPQVKRLEAQSRVSAVRSHRFRSGAERWKLGPGVDVETALARLRGRSDVEYAEPNYRLSIERTPDDPLFSQMYALRNTGQTGGTFDSDIDADEAWEVTTGSRAIVVAVIDTGIDYEHPDLRDNMWVNEREIPDNGVDDDDNGFVDDWRGWNFVNNDNDPYDDNDHGTHVAGIIGAVGNNGQGITGVCWQVRIMSVKFLNSWGWGTTADAVEAIDYAAMMGASIINASWGGTGFSQTLLDSIHAAGERDVLFVAAAGNSRQDLDFYPFYPAAFGDPVILSVAATNSRDQLADFSNVGRVAVDLAAPGVDILSTIPNGNYEMHSGTSMAAPHVAGAAALVRSVVPGLGALVLKQMLMDQGDIRSSLLNRTVSGRRLNAYRSIPQAESIPPAAVTNLAAIDTSAMTVLLRWSATGDDGGMGRASRYELRYSTSPLNELNFSLASEATGVPRLPLPPGGLESFRLRGLEPNTQYWLALRVFDEFGNASPISNVVMTTTLPAPYFSISPDSLRVGLAVGDSTEQLVSLINDGPNPIQFHVTAYLPNGASIDPSGTPPVFSSRQPSRVPSSDEMPDPGSGRDIGEGRRALNHQSSESVVQGVGLLLLGDAEALGFLRDELAGFPDVARVQLFDWSTELSLDMLLQYDSVIVDSEIYEMLGDLLADYVERGGGVVLAQSAFMASDYGEAWPSGRLVYEYLPLTSHGPVPGISTLGTFDPGHLIVRGASTASASGVAEATLAEGAGLVASYVGGNPFIATKGEHVVAINLRLGLAASWNGDLPLLIHNAALWSRGPLPWLTLSPSSGIVAPHSVSNLRIGIDASSLTADQYSATLRIESSDPDRPEVLVPLVVEVSGHPDLSIQAEVLDFGQVAVGASGRRSLRLWNRGTADLLLSSMVTNHPAFLSGPSPSILAPGSKRSVDITFSPTAADRAEGSLFIHSNDPNRPDLVVALSGEGLAPPRMHVMPSSIQESIDSGQRIVRLLTIQNSGFGNLDFGVTIRDESGYENPRRTPAGTSPHSLLVQDDSFYGVGSLERVLGELGVDYHRVDSRDLASVDLATYKTIFIPSGSYTPYSSHVGAQMSRLQAFVEGGGVLELHVAGGWTVNPSTLPAGLRARWYGTFLNWIADPSHPIVAGLQNPFILGGTLYGPYGSECYFTDLPAGGTSVLTDDLGRPNLVTYRVGLGLVIASCQTFEYDLAFTTSSGTLLRNMAAFALGLSADWSSVSPQSGTIPPGGAQQIAIGLEGRSIGPASLSSSLRIASNDPASPEVAVPISLEVRGKPKLALLGEPITVESASRMYPQLSHTLNLPSPPAGSGELEVVLLGDFDAPAEFANISVDGRWIGIMGGTGCAAFSQSFSLPSELMSASATDGEVQIRLMPSGEVDGSLCSSGNWKLTRLHYRSRIERLEFGPTPPQIGATQEVNLENQGTGTLEIASIRTDSTAFTASPASLTLVPGQQSSITVAFNPPGSGEFAGVLELSTNDPDSPVVRLPLIGRTPPIPRLDWNPTSLSESLKPGSARIKGLTIENEGEGPLDYSLKVAPDTQSVPACDPSALYIAGNGSGIQKVNRLTQEVDVIAADLYSTTIALDSSGQTAYVADGWTRRISGVNLHTGIVTVISDDIEYPRALTLGSDGTLFVLVFSYYNGTGQIIAIDPENGIQHVLVSVSGLINPTGIALDPSEAAAYVLDVDGYDYLTQRGRLLKVDFGTRGVTVVADDLGSPEDLVVNRAGTEVFLTDSLVGRVLAVDLATGKSRSVVPWGLPLAEGIALEPLSDDLIVSHGGYGAGVSRINPATGETELLKPLSSQSDVAVCDLTRFVHVSSTGGTVPAHQSKTIDVTFHSGNLPAGEHRALIHLTSNDPAHPMAEIPAALTVTSVPKASAVPASLSFPTTFVGYTSSLPIVIWNLGTDALHLSGIKAFGDFHCECDGTSQEIKVGQSLSLVVTFSPRVAGSLAGSLRVLSDDPLGPVLTVPLSGGALDPPRASVTPGALDVEFTYQTLGARERILTLTNSGGSALDWSTDAYVLPTAPGAPAAGSAEPEPPRDHGGPDGAGYRWRDSDARGGPAFDWIEIRNIGTLIPLGTGPNARTGIPIGFGFPFYGLLYTTLGVSTDGYITFSTPSYAEANRGLPSIYAPPNLIAILWHGRWFTSTSKVHYWRDDQRFIIQFTDVPGVGNDAKETFQAILYKDGRIRLQYLTLSGQQLNQSTVGIQNATRDIGLTVASYTSYLHDHLAIEISRLPPLISLREASGVLSAGASINLHVLINPFTLTPGAHVGEIRFFTNDPVAPELVVPVTVSLFNDADLDGVVDDNDNCVLLPNPDQRDADGDHTGDLCDICTDVDRDGFGNPGFQANQCQVDNCPGTPNPFQEDSDGDGIGDVCDWLP